MQYIILWIITYPEIRASFRPLIKQLLFPKKPVSSQEDSNILVLVQDTLSTKSELVDLSVFCFGSDGILFHIFNHSNIFDIAYMLSL